MCLAGVGSRARLRRGPVPGKAAEKPWPVRQAEALTAAVAAALAVGAFAFSPTFLNWDRYQPGADSTWAQIWTGGHTFIASYGHQIEAQSRAGVYRDRNPTNLASP